MTKGSRVLEKKVNGAQVSNTVFSHLNTILLPKHIGKKLPEEGEGQPNTGSIIPHNSPKHFQDLVDYTVFFSTAC